jgi:hypothetical protein
MVLHRPVELALLSGTWAVGFVNRKERKGLSACSLAAGLLGGILSHYAAPVLVHAQTQTTPAKEISAQRFVLVNAAGVPQGEFGIDKDGNASIQLLDKDGRVVWSAGKTKAKPLSASIAK